MLAKRLADAGELGNAKKGVLRPVPNWRVVEGHTCTLPTPLPLHRRARCGMPFEAELRVSNRSHVATLLQVGATVKQ